MLTVNGTKQHNDKVMQAYGHPHKLLGLSGRVSSKHYLVMSCSCTYMYCSPQLWGLKIYLRLEH